MKSVIIEEQKRYSRNELKTIFETKEEETISIIKKLKEINILKVVRKNSEQYSKSDLLDEDVEIVDEEEYSAEHYYVFTFVGIILVNKQVLKCYPKYLNVKEYDEVSLENKMRLIVKVLQKYNKNKEQVVKLYLNSNKNKTFNLLAATVYLMNDYYENGIYTNEQNIIESNGSGEIDWNRTIGTTYPVIRENKPYYLELQTRKRIIDDYDYFKKLHEIILTKCSKEIEDAELMNVLELSPINLSEDSLEELGEEKYVLNRLRNEKQIQYNTRKLELLSVLEAYISNKGTIKDVNNFNVFGTNSFNLVWEEACGTVLDNQLEKSLKDLDVPNKQESDETLLSTIKKPKWIPIKGGKGYEKDGLIPDMIAIGKVGDEYEFDIFDAKYYNTKIDSTGVEGQPGVESIVKQYVYQMAYKDFIDRVGIKKVNNCFIMPMDTKSKTLVKLEGNVEMEIFKDMGTIKVRKLQAERVYEYYLKGKTMSIKKMKL